MPSSAELKLIKKLQERVAKRTKDYDKTVAQAMRETEEAKDEAKEISGKQGRVEDLTRKLANKQTKNEENR